MTTTACIPNRGTRENDDQPASDAQLDRRTVIRAAATAGIAQFAAPFRRSPRGPPTTIKFGLDDPLTGTYAELGKNEQIGCQLAISRDQRQGRHSRPPGPAAGRGFDQRRYRHRGAEGAQADRARQGRFPARQRQFGDGARARRGLEPAQDIAHRHRRPYRRGHRHRLPLERVPRVQHDADGDQFGLADLLFNKYGKKWYFITPDYAFGHTLQQGFEAT